MRKWLSLCQFRNLTLEPVLFDRHVAPFHRCFVGKLLFNLFCSRFTRYAAMRLLVEVVKPNFVNAIPTCSATEISMCNVMNCDM